MDPIDDLKEGIKEASKNLGTAQRALQEARIGEAEKEWLKHELDSVTKKVAALEKSLAYISAKR